MKVLSSIFVIIGAIIGAGFASGKEIFVFFANYGILSILFIIPVFFLFLFIIYKTILLGNLISQNNIKYINNYLFKDKSGYFNLFNLISMIILCSSMCGALRELLQTNNIMVNIFLNLIIIFLMFLICKYGINFLSIISIFLIPLIIIVMTYILCSNISYIEVFSNNAPMLSVSSLLYTFMNGYLSMSIIIKTGSRLSKKQAFIVALSVSFVVCLILILAILCIFSNIEITQYSFPFLSLANSPILHFLFYTILIVSILTTLFSCLISCNDTFDKIKGRMLILPLLVFILSFIGFSNVVRYLYPIIGLIGFVVLGKVLFFKPLLNNSDSKIHKTRK